MKAQLNFGIATVVLVSLIVSPIFNDAIVAPKKGWPRGINITAPSKGHRTMKDLKPGITFAAPPGVNPQANCYGVAVWAGLKKDEWKIIEFGSMGTAVNAIPDDGKADIVWWIPDAGV